MTFATLSANSGHGVMRRKTSLFDHLVGGGEQRLRHGEPECLRGFEIDDQLKFSGLLNWQFTGLLAPENAVDVGSRAPIKIEIIDAVRHKASGLSIVTKRKNCR